MKKLYFLFSLFIVSFSISAQESLPKNRSVFFELAGSGGFGSFNYERTVTKKEKWETTFRIGLSIAPIDKNNGFGFVFPIMFNVLYGKNAHKLECGLGQGITITTKGSGFFLTTATLGYRYQPADKKMFYRITYTPLISYLIDFQVQQWAGLSIGYTFKKVEQ